MGRPKVPSTRRPVHAKHRSAPISNSAVAQENAVTRGATGLLKESLNALQCGSRWAAVNPTALMRPMAVAAAGAHGCRCRTRTRVRTASRYCRVPATVTWVDTTSTPRRRWSAPCTATAVMKTTATPHSWCSGGVRSTGAASMLLAFLRRLPVVHRL
jgi:hypothetical protein